MGALLTKEGGIAVQMINNTGATSKKGTLVHASESMDMAADLANLAGFDTIGVVYNDGSEPGQEMWVIISGVADVLLEDGTASYNGSWVRGSNVQQGRANAESTGIPGDTSPDSLDITQGTLISGTVSDLSFANGAVVRIREGNVTPGIDATLTFTPDEAPERVEITGRYAGGDGHSVTIQAWNNTASDWDTLTSMAISSSYLSYSANLTSDHYSGSGEVLIRFYHAAEGTTAHNLYLDQAVVAITASLHFKEIGHCLQAKEAGTDELARISLHFN